MEVGPSYAIVISTNGGLWRYMPGDTVRFTSLRPHRIQVSGRTKSFINAFGEELIVENADRGIEAACEATGAVVNEYTAAPVYMGNSATRRTRMADRIRNATEGPGGLHRDLGQDHAFAEFRLRCQTQRRHGHARARVACGPELARSMLG